MRKIIFQYCVVAFSLLSTTACNWFSFQDTDRTPLGGIYELIGEDTTSIASDNKMPPYIYRQWVGMSETNPQHPIDSLFFLKNKEGELIDKWAIKELIGYSKKNERYEYLLSNGKYIYFECDRDMIYTVSEQVESEVQLKNNLKTGRYIYLAEKPDKW